MLKYLTDPKALLELALVLEWDNPEQQHKTAKKYLPLVDPEVVKTMGSFSGSGRGIFEVVKYIGDIDDVLPIIIQTGSFVTIQKCLRYQSDSGLMFVVYDEEGHEVIVHETEIETP